MGFVVTENNDKGFKDHGFTNGSSKIQGEFEDLIEGLNILNTTRNGKQSTPGKYRIDITAASGGNMLLQMQSKENTFASALYSSTLFDTIVGKPDLFKKALKDVYTICQDTGKNTIITWGNPPAPAPVPAPAQNKKKPK